MPQMYLRQPKFTYSAWGQFIKNKERIQTLKKPRRFTIYLSVQTTKLAFNMTRRIEIESFTEKNTFW